MSRFLSAVLLSGALSLPLAMQAQDHDRDHEQHDQRYYDESHKDYHQWNDNENRAYQQYARGRHMKDRDWSHASKRDQQQYWSWRHDHPDGR